MDNKKQILKNEELPNTQMMVIDERGSKLGTFHKNSALAIAKSRGLDLVSVSLEAKPIIVKFMDYNKFKFDQQKKQKQNKQVGNKLKEIQLSYKIQKNDMMTKARNAEKFLSKNDKVKVNLRLKGRENTFVKEAIEKVKEFISMITIETAVESPLKVEGENFKNIIVIIRKK